MSNSSDITLKSQLTNLLGSQLISEELRGTVEKWASTEISQDYLQSLISLLESTTASTEINKRFNSSLKFGTAGIRAKMGLGSNCLNYTTVVQTALCLHDYLCELYGKSDCEARGVIIGYDGRRNSWDFARYIAAVFVAKGTRVFLFRHTVITPFVSFGVSDLNCICGVMVTASHNPKEDNGIKVYSDIGSQLMIEDTNNIERRIRESPDIPIEIHEMISDWDNQVSTRVVDPYRNIADRYQSLMLDELRHPKSQISKGSVRVVYSAFHGVAYPMVHSLLKTFGFPVESHLFSVAEQQDPDPEFSTLTHCNPEYKESFALSAKRMHEVGADMILANDPDGDRFTCIEHIPNDTCRSTKSGSDCSSLNCLRWFSGDEIGIIFAHRLLCLYKEKKKSYTKDSSNLVTSNKDLGRHNESLESDRSDLMMLTTIVSSRMLKKFAEMENLQYAESLTGHKWLNHEAQTLKKRNSNLRPLFIYEEALGYAVSQHVSDKDGVAALAVWVDLASELYNLGQTVSQYLGHIQDKYGNYYQLNSAVPYGVSGNALWVNAVSRLRNNGKYVWKIGTFDVERIQDLEAGFDSQGEDKVCFLGQYTCRDGSVSRCREELIILYFCIGIVYRIRPSGTEGKVKMYVEGRMCDDVSKDTIVGLDKCVKEFIFS